MPMDATTYQDDYGADVGTKEQWGAKTEREMQARSLKQYNPAAGQFQNISPNTAPGPKKVRAPKGVAPYQPVGAYQRPSGQTAQTGMGPGSNMETTDVEPQPRVGKGMGASGGLLPKQMEDQIGRPQSPGYAPILTQSAGEALQHLASLPNASPVMQLYARIARQTGGQ